MQAEMEYRQLGGTALKVSVVGFGASPLGNVFRRTDPEEGTKTVHFAIERGINFFDVSPYYGLTLAESRLGRALHGYRDEIVLATKCGRYGVDEFDFSAGRVASSLEESLRRLKTDHIDLLQAHDVEFGNLQQVIEETIPAMRKLQEQGKVQYVGITGYPLKALRTIIEQVPVDTVLTYCRYNLMIDDMDKELLHAAMSRGVGVVNASALHMGVVTERGAPDWHPASARVREAGKRIVDLCKSRKMDASKISLRFCFDHPQVASTLVGMSTPTHVQAALDALAMRSDPAILREIREVIGTDFGCVWMSGKPENNDGAD